MNIPLIDALPVDVIKTLAKRYLKLKSARGDEPVMSLMSIQEDLAKAAGHRDMHAAQEHWNNKDTAANPVAGVSSRDFSLPASWVLETAEGMARTSGWFTVDALIEGCLQRKIERDGQPDNIEAARDMIENQVLEEIDHPRHFKTSNGFVTTQTWIQSQNTLTYLSGLSRRAMKADVDAANKPNKESVSENQRAAIKVATGSDDIVAIEATYGASKSLVMRGVADAYRKSRWQVIGCAPSKTESQVVGCILNQAKGQSITIDTLIQRVNNKDSTLFNEPTLVILDNAHNIPAMVAFELARAAHNADVPVKIMVLGESRKGIAYNAFSAITNISTTHRLIQESSSMPAAINQDKAAANLSTTVEGKIDQPLEVALPEKEKAAREIDPAILGRAFLQVMNDPKTAWRDRPFHEFSSAMAARAAELHEASKTPGSDREQGTGARAPGRRR